jgi:O-antigen/teichoic acid export membrane protein
MFDKLKPKTEFAHHVSTLMTGSVIAQALPVAVSPILTRIYTAEDFGLLALYIAIVAIFSSIAGGRYEFAIILPKEEKEAINIFALSFILSVVFSLLLTLLIVFFYNEINGFFIVKIGMWLYFMPISVFFTALFNFLTLYNNRTKNYKDIALSTVIKSSVLVFLQLLIGFFKGGATGLLTGQIFSSFFANMKLLKNIIQTEYFFSQINRVQLLLMAKEYIKFPKYQMPNALLNSFASQMPIFLLSSFFFASMVGLYALATRILFTPLMIIANANSKVYNQALAEIHNSNGDSYLFTIKFLKSLFQKIILPFGLIVLFAPQLFTFIFGEVWREAGVYTQILSPYILLNVMVSSVAFIASLLQQQQKSLLISMVHTTLIVMAILIGGFFKNIYLSLALYSSVSVMILLYNLIWMLMILKKDVDIKKGCKC